MSDSSLIINGFQKMTLLDYPEKVACTIFFAGCNFRCPFCHNASLVVADGYEKYTAEEILEYLKKRKGLLDGVCITGGEPLLREGLREFIAEIKAMGYSVKLDTNGSFPERLKALVNDGLVDYVAMDIKNSLEKYPETAGVEALDVKKIEESIDFLLEGRIDYEFRTTVVRELHTEEDIENIARRISGAVKYFLQNFVDSGDLIGENLSAHSLETFKMMQNIAKKYIKDVVLRGV